MITHTFKLLLVVVALVYVPFVKAQQDDRTVWIGAMTRIADPVLTAVIRNQFKSPANFDSSGWLCVGFTGEQLNMSESYINTGSVYLCAVGLLALGLPATDEFWSEPFTEWTNLKAWSGKEVKADHAL